MNMDRAGMLPRPSGARVGQRVLDEQRLPRKSARRIAPVHIELALAFDRNIDPRSAGMKIQMPRPEPHAVAGLDRRRVGQYAILETKDLERTRVYRIVAGRVVAACDQDDVAIVGRGADLVRVFSGVELVRLGDALSERAVPIDAMHGE